MTANLTVETVQLQDLQLDPHNVRRHPESNLEAIAASLEQFGQRRPLVVHRDVVIAGNGTLMAAKSLGWTEVAITRVPDDWTDEQAKAYAIADNRTAELAEWDPQLLAATLTELDAAGIAAVDLGFEMPEQASEAELADAFDSLTKEKGDFEQITFTLHNDQAATIREALAVAKDLGDYGDTGNPNGNGNAIARIAELFLGEYGVS